MKAQMSVLPKGLRVISVYKPSSKIVNIGIAVKAGSRNEPEDKYGLAHFVEHMVFCGTKKRSEKNVWNEWNKLNNCAAAHTTVDTTFFYGDVLKEDFEQMLDLMSDMLINSSFDLEKIEREKKVVCQEISQDGGPSDIIAAVYARQSVCKVPCGTEESVRSLTREDAVSFYNQFYCQKNIVITIIGDIEHEGAKLLAEAYFGEMNEGSESTVEKTKHIGGATTFEDYSKNIKSFLCFDIGCGECEITAAKAAVINILDNRIRHLSRNVNGFTYNNDVDCTMHADCGFLCISANCKKSCLDTQLRITAEQIRKIFFELVGDDELADVKHALRLDVIYNSEDYESLAEDLSEEVLFSGKIKDVEQLLAEIDALTKEDVQKAAQEIFSSKQPAYVIKGNTKYHFTYSEMMDLINGKEVKINMWRKFKRRFEKFFWYFSF